MHFKINLLPTQVSSIKNTFSIATIFLILVFGWSESILAGTVNINKADAVALQENMVGIGPVKAKAIVDYRRKNGSFSNIEELKNVPGIGPETVKSNRKNMSVSRGAVKSSGKLSKDTAGPSDSQKSTNSTSGAKKDKNNKVKNKDQKNNKGDKSNKSNKDGKGKKSSKGKNDKKDKKNKKDKKDKKSSKGKKDKKNKKDKKAKKQRKTNSKKQ